MGKRKTLNEKHNTSRVSEKLIKTLFSLSEEQKDFFKATMEWKVTNYIKKEYIEGETKHHCMLCGKDELCHLFEIKNIKTGNTVEVVGSHCIFRHFILEKQVEDIMRFIERNIHRRKMLYGKYVSEGIIKVLKKDPNYIIQEIEKKTEFDKYFDKLKGKKKEKTTVSFECMKLLYIIHIRAKRIYIDQNCLDQYLHQKINHNKHEKNYTRMPPEEILQCLDYDE